jgi:hypothetical protein
MDAHGGELPDVSAAYQFLLDNPECFLDDDGDDIDREWPVDMPVEPPAELVAAYGSDPALEAVKSIAADAGIRPLDAQGRDSLDFRELHVDMLRRMLLKAYRAGKAAR